MAKGTSDSRGRSLDRRGFLKLSAAAAAGGALAGCATNPVTGSRQLMFVSEAEEVSIDQQNAPHQFSADYGAVQDPILNAYVTSVGRGLADGTHRPNVPYSFRAVNATYVNAYTFPGGSMAVTRGILLSMQDEAELAALLGHELGHVNARHTAQRMTQGILASLAATAAAIYVQEEYEKYAPLAVGLGSIGTGLLLAHYSRSNEREADELGMDYMARAGYAPEGMVGLMDVLRGLSHGTPSVIDRMFASHPMSEERYETARGRAVDLRQSAVGTKRDRDRYLDATASVRKIGGAIERMQQGDAAMVKEQYDPARQHYEAALKVAPNDYVGLLSMARCLIAQDRPGEARPYVAKARAVYPDEPLAVQVEGMVSLKARRFGDAHIAFSQYAKLLPGNPNTVFYDGFALESMGRKNAAARQYDRYLGMAPAGELSGHARQRLTEWVGAK